MSKEDALAKIAETLVERIAQIGELPWRRTWNANAFAVDRNAFTGRKYNGINALVFEYSRLARGFDCASWGTFATLRKNGVNVKKGETGTTGVIYRPVYKKNEEGENEFAYSFFGAMTFFNLNQTDAVITKAPETEENENNLDLKFYGRMPSIPKIGHGSAGASYTPMLDLVQMPNVSAFECPEEYVTTLAHELVHSTGSSIRLDRFAKYSEDFEFEGRQQYGFEELVAAIGENLICRTLHVKYDADNNAAYLKNWLKVLQDDPKMIIRAASYAQKAHDYILQPLQEA